MSNFLILIGGPGTYKACDPKHDKTWLNYFVPVQIAAINDLYKKGTDSVHWIVYKPAYLARWLDDDEIDFWEGFVELFSGRNLHKLRKAATDKVKIKGATNYLHRIEMIARTHGITYKGIDSPAEFWEYIGTFPSQSISRVWYSGHANEDGLILELLHNSECGAAREDYSTVQTDNIKNYTNLKNRFLLDTKHASKFYGCHTSEFAKKWNKTFVVPTEGAAASITFERIFDNPVTKVLENLETTPTPEGSPIWTTFGTVN